MYEIKLSTEKTGVEVWVQWDVLKNSKCYYLCISVGTYIILLIK
jgi:hypothetical protein